MARLSWPGRLVTYRDGLPVRRRSPIQVLTELDVRVTSLIETNALLSQTAGHHRRKHTILKTWQYAQFVVEEALLLAIWSFVHLSPSSVVEQMKQRIDSLRSTVHYTSHLNQQSSLVIYTHEKIEVLKFKYKAVKCEEISGAWRKLNHLSYINFGSFDKYWRKLGAQYVFTLPTPYVIDNTLR